MTLNKVNAFILQKLLFFITILIKTHRSNLLVIGVKQDTLTFLNCGQLCAEIGLHAAYLGLSKSLIREKGS